LPESSRGKKKKRRRSYYHAETGEKEGEPPFVARPRERGCKVKKKKTASKGWRRRNVSLHKTRSTQIKRMKR